MRSYPLCQQPAVPGTQVTDDGLEHLKGFIKLERLELDHTLVTEDGVNQLRTALPNCDIKH